MADRTVEQWLDLLCQRMDRQRPRLRTLRSYANGDAPLPDMGPELKESWQRFQAKSRMNLGELIVEALANRIIPNGIEVAGTSTSEVALRCQRIWRDNRLDVAVPDAIRDALTVSRGYLMVTMDDDGKAVITREDPELMFVEPDPVRPWRSLAALKVWRDWSVERDYADLYVNQMKVSFERGTRTETNFGKPLMVAYGGWNLIAAEPYTGRVPIVVLENKGASGEYEGHTDLIDRINWGVLQRLVTTALQAFRQRALKQTNPDVGGLEDTDEDGNAIDYRRIFTPGPNALWELPPGVELWESQQADLTPMLSAVKDDLRFLSAVTQTPVSMLIPEGANQSASGAEFAREGLVGKAADRIKRFSPALAVMLVYALAAEGVESPETVRVTFEPPAMVSLTEKYAAAGQAKAVGESLETIQRDILGKSSDQIQRDKALRAQDQLALAAFGLQQPQQKPPTSG